MCVCHCSLYISDRNLLLLSAGMLVNDFTMSTIIGAMGFIRVILPKILAFDRIDIQVIHKIIEIYEICLHLLNEKNHSIINASLECMCVILSNAPTKLAEYFGSDHIRHMTILGKRRSLKNLIFCRKTSNASSIQLDNKSQLFASPRTPSRSKCTNTSAVIESDLLNETHIPFDDKALLTGSDGEIDSLRATDTDGERGFDSPARTPIVLSHLSNHNDSLRSPRPTDTVGSFFNTILSHPNTGKFTRTTNYIYSYWLLPHGFFLFSTLCVCVFVCITHCLNL